VVLEFQSYFSAQSVARRTLKLNCSNYVLCLLAIFILLLKAAGCLIDGFYNVSTRSKDLYSVLHETNKN